MNDVHINIMDFLVPEYIKILTGSICMYCSDGTYSKGRLCLTACCGKIYHLMCMNTASNTSATGHACLCGSDPGQIVADLPTIIWRLVSNHEQLSAVYHYIVHYCPSMLLETDRQLRSIAGDNYYTKYRGYFRLVPIVSSSTTMKIRLARYRYDLEKMTSILEDHTYGIFQHFDWGGFFLCGALLARILLNYPSDSSDPICLILHADSYRAVRARIGYFCRFIRCRFRITDPIPVTVRNNKIKFYIPGFVRGIILHVSLCGSDTLQQLLGDPESQTTDPTSHSTCSSLNFMYDGNDYYATTKGIYLLRGNDYRTVLFPRSCFRYWLTYNQGIDDLKSSRNTHIADTNTLLDSIYGIYTLRVRGPMENCALFINLDIELDFRSDDLDITDIHLITPREEEIRYEGSLCRQSIDAFIKEHVYNRLSIRETTV